MSGFIGYMVNKMCELEENEEKTLESMMESIKHRGTEYSGFYADDYIRFGCQILNTINTGDNHQPLSYENERYWIVFDGVIYNYMELASQLEDKGYIFENHTDTEVLLALYADRQERLLKDLRGMFSFLIWDKEGKELFGARDSFGIKPFYFMENKEGLYFSSEMKSLYGCFGWDKNNINLEALQHYFSFQYVPEPQTMQENIRKLEAGHYFYKKPGEPMNIKSFSQLDFAPKNYSMEEQKKKIQNALRESVHLHMQSNSPVGVFLSGGVDSSAIVAFAKEIKPSIKTFTVGFKREGYSEIDIAKKTAEQLKVENYHYIISPQEFIKELPNVIKYMDDPVADPSSVPFYIAAREAKKQVKVVLSGEGGDELFGGYNIYREPKALKVFDYFPKPMHKIMQKVASYFPEGMKGKSFIERGTSPLEDRFIGNAKIFSEIEKNLLLKDYHPDYHYKNVTQPLYNQVSDYPDIQKMQYIDLHTWARGNILVKADRMSMAHGLELRSPFFDKEVFKVASELLPEQVIVKGTTKYALREAVRGIVPDSVLYNKKLGFLVPIRYWLKDELYDWAKQIIENSPTDHLINKSYVLNLLKEHQVGKLNYSRKIWTVLVFMIWYEQ